MFLMCGHKLFKLALVYEYVCFGADGWSPGVDFCSSDSAYSSQNGQSRALNYVGNSISISPRVFN
jgi:hypothetical protein